MNNVLPTALTFDQIVSLVRQLSLRDKRKLSKVLAEEGVRSKLDSVLQKLYSPDLDIDLVNEEVEAVRKTRYEARED